MATKYLTGEEKRRGSRLFYLFSAFAGGGFLLTGPTIIILIALTLEANQLVIGYLAAVVNLSGIFTLFIGPLFGGKNAIKVGSVACLFRALSPLPLFYIWYVPSSPLAIPLLLFSYTLFSLARMVSLTMEQTMYFYLTSSMTRGNIILKGSNFFQFLFLGAAILGYLILRIPAYETSLTGIFLLLGVGIFFNSCAVYPYAKIPCRVYVEGRKNSESIFSFFSFLQMKRQRPTLIGYFLSMGILVICGFLTAYYREIANFTNSEILIYIIIYSITTILAGLFLGPFLDRVGSRPFIFFSSLLFFISTIFFLLQSPENKGNILFWGGLLNLSAAMYNLSIKRQALILTPHGQDASFNSLLLFLTSISAFIAGIGGGFLANFSSSLGWENVYLLPFVLGGVFAVISMIVNQYSYEPTASSILNTLSLFLSVPNMRAFNQITAINRTKKEKRRRVLLYSIGTNVSPIATQEMLRFFAMPIKAEKSDLLQTFFRHNKISLIQSIIDEATTKGSLYRTDAIFALGGYKSTPQILGCLQTIFFQDEDSLIASEAAKSLGRLRDATHYERVAERALEVKTLTEEINYLIALSYMDSEYLYLENLFRFQLDLDERYDQTIMTAYAESLDLSPSLNWLFQLENLRSDDGFWMLLEESFESDVFAENELLLQHHLGKQNYSDLVDWSKLECEKLSPQLIQNERERKRGVSLQRSILSFDIGEDELNASRVLGLFYFTFILIRMTEK